MKLTTTLCFIFLNVIVYAQLNPKIDNWWSEEDYEKIIGYYESGLNVLSEKDSAIVAKAYAAQQQNEKLFSLSKQLYKNHSDKIMYLLQSLSAATQLKNYLFVYTQSMRALDSGLHQKSVYRYAIAALNKMDHHDELSGVVIEGWKRYPNDAIMTLHYATLLQEQKKYDSSLNVIMPVLAKDSSQFGLLEKAVKAYYMKNDFKNAVTLANYLLIKDVFITNVLLYQLYSYYESKQYNDVVKLMRFIESIDNDNVSMLLIGAKAATAIKKYDLSNNWLEKAKRQLLDEEGAAVLHAMAANALQQGKHLLADKYYDTAIYIYDLPYSYYLKGIHYWETGKKELAKKQFVKYQNHPLAKTDSSATNIAILKYITQLQAIKKDL